jgi:predicted ATPase
MTPIQRNLEQIWQQLRSQQPSRANSLEDVMIKGVRGNEDLRVPLSFPVTVLAGPNGCGKSTVLFALACAYKVPGASSREYTPTSLFPDFRPKTEKVNGEIADSRPNAEITFSYVADHQRLSMKWSRSGKGSWNRSYFGRPKGAQPNRELYLRTLANLSNPSEVRSVLQMAQKPFEAQGVDAANIAFAQRILSFRYSSLTVLSSGLRNILFAERSQDDEGGGARYSEFHMSAGERVALRLSINLSRLQDALVLIDEVEVGLHPYVQQLLMLELQRLALRNRLQIVVTTHSPIILDTVPPEARIFLERSPDNVVRREPYRDIIQKALYGRSQNLLSVLCEDEEAEAFVRGVLDYLGPKIDFMQNDIEVGRDTGKDQFPMHLETLGRFRKLHDVIFILDGDGREVGKLMEARAEKMGQAARILYLPSNDPPEVWAWALLTRETARYARILGLSAETLTAKLRETENLYAAASDKPAAIAKNKLFALADATARSATDLMRQIGRAEASRESGEVFEFVGLLQDAINEWRSFG